MITDEYDILAAQKSAEARAYCLAVDHLMVTERDASVARATMVTKVDKMRTDVHTKDRAVAAARLAVDVAKQKLWEAEKRQ